MNRAALEALRGRWDRVRQAWVPGTDPAPLERAHAWLDLLDALLAPDAMVTEAGVPIRAADTPCGRGEIPGLRGEVVRAEPSVYGAIRVPFGGVRDAEPRCRCTWGNIDPACPEVAADAGANWSA